MDDDSGVIFPPSTSKWIKRARFLNILDDQHNILSPVKVNLWAANLTAFSAGVATVVAWIAGHLGAIDEVWAPIGGWLTQAHATHHYDKKERNRAGKSG